MWAHCTCKGLFWAVDANLFLSCDLLLVISCGHILLLDLLDGHRARCPCACFHGLQVNNGSQLHFFQPQQLLYSPR